MDNYTHSVATDYQWAVEPLCYREAEEVQAWKNDCAGVYCSSWSTVYNMFGRNDQAIYVIGSWLVCFVAFCLTNLILAWLDIAGVPRALHKYKIQQERNVPMDWWEFSQTMAVAGFNMTVVNLLHTLSLWPLARQRMTFGTTEIPGLFTTAQHLIISLIVVEPGFYYLHRLMHRSSILYKHVHKYHHSWKAPCAMATFYCHPLEHFFVNLLPLSLGPIVAGAHLSTLWLWYIVCLVNTTQAHCGYHFPFLPSSENHDFHHSRGIENYGTVGFLDWLHGTNQRFQSSPAYKRHFVIWGLTPAHAKAA